MPPVVAAVVFAIGILWLFYLDREENVWMSAALWIPAVWLFLISSRGVSLWLGMAPLDSPDTYVEGSPIDRAVLIVLVAAGLAVVIARAQKTGPLLRRNAPILLYFMFCAISILWSDFPSVAFKRWIKALGDVLIVLVILTEPDPLGAMKRLITRLGFLLFPLSVLFAKYYPSLGRRLTNSWTEEITGVTTQKNSLGVICMLFGVGFLWMLGTVYRDRADPARRRRLVAYGAILLMIVWLLGMCGSTTSISGLVMAGSVMFLATRSSLVRKRAVVHLLVFTAIGISLFAVFFQPGLLTDLGKDPTLSGRTQVWSLVFAIHTNAWVGTGFESFWLGQRLVQLRDALPNFPINEAHNGYIEVYLNLGWIGVSLIALLLVTGYRKAINLFRQDPGMGSLFLGFFLAVVSESLTEASFRMLYASWVFFVLLLFATSLSVPSKGLAKIGPIQADDVAEGRGSWKKYAKPNPVTIPTISASRPS